ATDPTSAGPQSVSQGHPGGAAETGTVLIETGARLLALSGGFYDFSLLRSGSGRHPVGPMLLPAVHLCAAPLSADLHIASRDGRGAPWLAGSQRLLVTAPSGGAVALLTGYRACEAVAEPVEIEGR